MDIKALGSNSALSIRLEYPASRKSEGGEPQGGINPTSALLPQQHQVQGLGCGEEGLYTCTHTSGMLY
ncbi:hypothetical protein EON65_45745 [archaeon]|nr:MAG: hypothetical protein EON65_45745 [archaeon]